MRIETNDDDVLLWIKAVPGASRDELAGAIGDRLKIRISAPPEGGKANKAIITLIARSIGIKPAQITIEAGQSSPEKIVRIAACPVERIRKTLAL